MMKKSLAIFVFCLGAGVFLLLEDRMDHAPVDPDGSMDSVLFPLLNIDEPQRKTGSVAMANKSRHPEMQLRNPGRDAARYEQPVEDLPGMKEAEADTAAGNSEISVALWEPQAKDDSESESGASVVHEEGIQTDADAFANLQVGQVVEFFIPQLGEAFQSEIDSTSNQLGNVKVWKGKIQDDEDKSNFIMTQGDTMTHVVLATSKGIYTAYIDNESGNGAIVDDREYTENTVDTDDSVPFHHEGGQE